MRRSIFVALAIVLLGCTKETRTARIEVTQETRCNSSYSMPSKTVTTTTVTGTEEQIRSAISQMSNTSTSSSYNITCTVTQTAREI